MKENVWFRYREKSLPALTLQKRLPFYFNGERQTNRSNYKTNLETPVDMIADDGLWFKNHTFVNFTQENIINHSATTRMKKSHTIQKITNSTNRRQALGICNPNSDNIIMKNLNAKSEIFYSRPTKS